MQIIHGVFLIILVLGINSFGQKVGIIYELKGTAVLKGTDGKESQLNQKNYARTVKVGQQLKATNNGEIKIWLCQGRLITVSGKNWFSVPSCSTEKGPDWLTVFDVAGRTNNYQRGDGDFILFPIQFKDCPGCYHAYENENVLRPETAIFRWKTVSEKQLLCSIIIVGQNFPMWKREADCRLKSFTSDELRKLLDDVREMQPNVKLQLKLSIASLGTENYAEFRIFSLENEEKLQKELAETNSEQGVLRHLARAEIYSRYKLYNEVAYEYEKALKLSPESIELSNATAWAQDRAGNFERRDKINEDIRLLKK